jgi:hypothetical protein
MRNAPPKKNATNVSQCMLSLLQIVGQTSFCGLPGIPSPTLGGYQAGCGQLDWPRQKNGEE